MQTADELHRLVHSLTSWEKRAFTTHARRNGKSPQYLRLFLTLDRLEEYDATLVRKAFKGTLAEKNLNELRYLLLEELVSAVDRRQISEDVVARMAHEAEAIDFLAARGCYATAERRLRKARIVARTHELPSALLALCAVQRRAMPLTPTSQQSLMADEECALAIAQDHHDAARQLQEWTQIATSLARFTVVEHDPSPEPLTQHDATRSGAMVFGADSALGRLRRLHSDILRSGCARNADALVTHAHALACLLADRRVALTAYAADVNFAIIDLADEAALMDVTSRIEALALPAAQSRADVLHQRSASLMRTALRAVTLDDLEAASKAANLVLNDPALSQAHEAWTAQATLVAATLYKISGHRRLLEPLVRGALRTEERRSRFTNDERKFLRALVKPLVQRTSMQRQLLESRNAASGTASGGTLSLLLNAISRHQPSRNADTLAGRGVSARASGSQSARSASTYVLQEGRYRR